MHVFRKALCALASISMLSCAVAALGAAPAGATVSSTTTVVGTDDIAPNGTWALAASSGTYGFVSGPATPPAGTGSLSLGVAEGQHEWFNNYAYGACATTSSCNNPATMTPISQITALSYAGYRTSGTTYPSYNVEVYTTGSSGYTSFAFVPNPGAIVDGSWQTWDAFAGTNGLWYSSQDTGAGTAFHCAPFSCSLPSFSAVQSAFPNAKIVFGLGPNVGTGGTFAGNVDTMTVGVNSATTVFDFEASCTKACYVAPTGSDSAAGHTGDPLATIQAGLDRVQPGGTVYVRPGSYDETAPNVTPASVGGTYQFGLYLGKDNVTVQGVDASDQPITSSTNVVAHVTTNSTADFGPDGVFVEGTGDTIRGLAIGANAGGGNKTIEDVGQGFTLDASVIEDFGGSVYIDDFRYSSANGGTPFVTTYALTNNRFVHGASVDIASGAGGGAHGGATSGRVISGNVFDGGSGACPQACIDAGADAVGWPSISFNGAGTSIGWYTDPVGAAAISGNTFHQSSQYIRFRRGASDTTVLPWSSYWANNSFATGVIDTTDGNPDHLRSYSYDNSSYPPSPTFPVVQRIGGTIQAVHAACTGNDCNGELTHASAGDTVYVGAGTFDETLVIDKAITLLGANHGVSPNTGTRGPETVVPNDSGANTTFDVTTSAPVTIDGFSTSFAPVYGAGQVSVGGILRDIQQDNHVTFSHNIVSNSTFNNALLYLTSALTATVNDNYIHDIGQYGSGTTGILATWGTPSQQATVDVQNNVFKDQIHDDDGTPAMNVNDAGGTIANNTFQNIHQYGILLADTLANLTISDNTFDGIVNDNPGASQNRGAAIRTFMTPDFAGPVTVTRNLFENSYHGVRVANDGSGATLNSNFTVNHNAFLNTAAADVSLAGGTIGTLDATCNWWGSTSGPQAGDTDGAVTTSPWLASSALNDPNNCYGGLPLPKISIGSLSVVEGNVNHVVDVPVTLDHASIYPVTVKFTTKDGTATVANSDYVKTSGVLTFAPGETTKNVSVTVVGDTVAEKFETFKVQLSNPSNSTLANAQATENGTVTLQNDDLPKLTAVAGSLTVNEGSDAVVQFKLNVAYYLPITVNVSSVDKTAKAPGDYVPVPGGTSFTIPAGSVTTAGATITVHVNADTVVGEPQESFKVVGDPVTAGMANKVVTIYVPSNNT